MTKKNVLRLGIILAVSTAIAVILLPTIVDWVSWNIETTNWAGFREYFSRPVTEMKVGEAIWWIAILLYIFSRESK